MASRIETTPLVGRQAELGRLQTDFDAVQAGAGGHVTFVSGAPGVGKTRLVHEFGAYVRGREGFFVEGRYLPEGNAPFGPWIDVLRSAVRQTRSLDPATLLEPYRAELSQVMPEFAAHGPTGSSALAPEEQRRRLYEGIAHLIARVSQQAPMVILLDDLQWAPGLTLLAHIARIVPGCRALVIGAYRPEEFNQQPRLTQIWSDLNRARLSFTINLQPLTATQTVGFLGHHFGPLVADHLAEPVHRRAHGNAFFMEEIVQSLVERGTVRWAPDGWQLVTGDIGIPESMKLAILERVGRLGELHEAVLTQAAVLGQEFPFAILQELTELSEDELVKILEGVVAARLLVDRSEPGEERYGFADDQIQEVLYATIPAPRRRRYHLRAGLLLERALGHHARPPLEQLARHFLESADAVRGAEYAARAGGESARLFNWPLAVRYYELALRALSHAPDTPAHRGQQVDLIIDRVSVSFGVDPGGNLSRLQEALRILKTSDTTQLAAVAGAEDSARLSRVLYWLGRSYVFRNQMTEAREYLQQAQAVAQRVDDEELLAIPVSAIGRLSHAQGRFTEAVDLLRSVLAPLERAANWPEWIASRGYLGAALAASGAYTDGLATAEAALARALDMQTLTGVAVAQVCAACVHLHGDNMPRMLSASRAAIQAAHQSGDRLFLFQAHVLAGWAAGRLKDDATAATSMELAGEILTVLGGRALFGDWFAAARAELTLAVGDVAAACQQAESALAVAQSVGGLFSQGVAHRVWARALAATAPPQTTTAEEHLRASLRAFEAGGARAELERTLQLRQTLLHDRVDASSPSNPDGLTARELEVLRLLAQGRTNREIAAELVISYTTVDRHISNIYAKIGAHGRAEAATYAVTHRVVQGRRGS